MHATPPAPVKHELLIGLVGAVGTNLRRVSDVVASSLVPYGYRAVPVRLSRLLHDLPGGEHLAEKAPEDERIRRHMDAGNRLRRQTRRDTVARLAMSYVYDHRQRAGIAGPADGTAFVLDSLKHPAEVATLRRTYGPRFVLVSVHAPAEARRDALARRIAASRGKPQDAAAYADAASALMVRDEHEEHDDFGQDVRGTFTEADVYVTTLAGDDGEAGLRRYLRLFFGDPYATPLRDEYAMFHAHAAALRSADLGRQVGAVIASGDGDIVAAGCNEVPRAFGGQYWPEDDPDKRDFQLGYDSNAKSRDDALDKAFDRLAGRGQIADGVSRDDFAAALRGTRLANVTEFGRTVHAEMAALLDAARRRVSVHGHPLYTTTFPCHNCARHIVAAGVTRVLYREPYPKSLAADLHDDAIVVDPVGNPEDRVVFRPYVGIGPPRYFDLFTMVERKDGLANRVDWSEAAAEPRLVGDETAYLSVEEDIIDELRHELAGVDLRPADQED